MEPLEVPEGTVLGLGGAGPQASTWTGASRRGKVFTWEVSNSERWGEVGRGHSGWQEQRLRARGICRVC